MTLLHRLMTTCTVLFVAWSAPAQASEIIGYYPSWKHPNGVPLLPPEKIPYQNLTIINYAFFAPLPDGPIVGRDTVGDALALRDLKLTQVAHGHGVRVLLSLGGWEDSGNFPAVAARTDTRTRFSHSCMERIREFSFDGIDIDWEFPGYADHNGTPDDRDNFILLLRELRDSLNTWPRHLLLTAAVPAGRATGRGLDIEAMNELLDFFNIMTYDFYGPWDPRADHNAPLFASEGGDRSRSIDGALRLYRDEYEIPPARLTIGIPFYGQTYAQCAGLHAPHTGRDTLHFPAQGAFYSAIMEQRANFTRYWDKEARVPYLVSKEWQTVVSYDDEESVRIKAEYARDHKTHGVIIWEITADLMGDGTTPLLRAVASVLRPAPTKP